MAHLHEIAHKFKWLMKMWTGHQNEVKAKKTNQHCPLKTFLICPHESSPASSIKLVTVNDSDDSSHLTKTAWNNLTSHPMQFGFGAFRWPTFYIHLNTSHYTSHIYHVCMLFTLPTEASQRFTLQCFLFLYHRKKKIKKNCWLGLSVSLWLLHTSGELLLCFPGKGEKKGDLFSIVKAKVKPVVAATPWCFMIYCWTTGMPLKWVVMSVCLCLCMYCMCGYFYLATTCHHLINKPVTGITRNKKKENCKLSRLDFWHSQT